VVDLEGSRMGSVHTFSIAFFLVLFRADGV